MDNKLAVLCCHTAHILEVGDIAGQHLSLDGLAPPCTQYLYPVLVLLAAAAVGMQQGTAWAAPRSNLETGWYLLLQRSDPVKPTLMDSLAGCLVEIAVEPVWLGCWLGHRTALGGTGLGYSAVSRVVSAHMLLHWLVLG